LEFGKIEFHLITPDFKVVLSKSNEPLILTTDVKARIECLWNQEKSKKGVSLFNGQILSCLEFNKEFVVAKFVEYKHFIAQRRDPHLRSQLNIDPIAVSGITFFNGKVLVGRRSYMVTQTPNHYEFAPSGGIDPDSLNGETVDYVEQITRELYEETEINQDSVDSCNPFVIIRNIDAPFWDICVCIKLKKDADIIDLHPTEEYSELRWMMPDEVKRLFLCDEVPVVSASRLICQEFIDDLSETA